MEPVQESRSQVYNAAAAGDFNGNSPTLILYSLADIETATDKFSIENKLGEGGYGPVCKVIFYVPRGRCIEDLQKGNQVFMIV